MRGENETGKVVSLAQTPGKAVFLGTVLSAKSLAKQLSQNPNPSPVRKHRAGLPLPSSRAAPQHSGEHPVHTACWAKPASDQPEGLRVHSSTTRSAKAVLFYLEVIVTVA